MQILLGISDHMVSKNRVFSDLIELMWSERKSIIASISKFYEGERHSVHNWEVDQRGQARLL